MATNSGPMRSEAAEDTTDDAALGGRLHLLQPRRGHRFGHDAILLAAATPAVAGDMVIDLGAGVGAAGLAVAARVAGTRLGLIEKDAMLARLAARNAERNGFGGAAKVATLDVTSSRREFNDAGFAAGSADCVLMNPPFHEAGHANPSRDPGRRAAYIGGSHVLAAWITCAERLLCAGGVLTLIYRADALDTVLALVTRDFGGIAVLPVYSKPAAAAIRVIVGARKGGRGSLTLCPALILNDGEGRPTPQAEYILRHAGALDLGI